ncbi:hypothetical protein PCL_02213 [Purpureocillium lilacinum]|uniref:Uncharacterized protein n=1 Tax=Purpureocillium lilacinum TaxID=33203 RepID=A0A2U3E1T2_PURLI|nr:hypothetical protein PCL_02213 [Purpureocillium lilacinum]
MTLLLSTSPRSHSGLGPCDWRMELPRPRNVVQAAQVPARPLRCPPFTTATSRYHTWNPSMQFWLGWLHWAAGKGRSGQPMPPNNGRPSNGDRGRRTPKLPFPPGAQQLHLRPSSHHTSMRVDLFCARLRLSSPPQPQTPSTVNKKASPDTPIDHTRSTARAPSQCDRRPPA